MTTVTCGNPYCRGLFTASYSPAICPHCGGQNTFNVYQPPAQLLTPFEQAQIQRQFEMMNYNTQIALQNSRKSIKEWLKEHFKKLYKRLKEIGAVKAGITAILALFGYSG